MRTDRNIIDNLYDNWIFRGKQHRPESFCNLIIQINAKDKKGGC